jgi:WD40 repeat protein
MIAAHSRWGTIAYRFGRRWLGWLPIGLTALLLSNTTAGVGSGAESQRGEQPAPYVETGHSDSVWRLAWTHSGHELLTASRDNTVIVWDAAHRRPRLTYTGHGKPIEALALSPDSELVATAARSFVDSGVQVWDRRSGRHVATLKGDPDSTGLLAWRSDSRVLATKGTSSPVMLWDPRTGERLATLPKDTESAVALAWAPGGNSLVVGVYQGTVTVFDTEPTVTRRRSLFFGGDNRSAETLVWNPAGSLFATASPDGTTWLWTVDTRDAPHLNSHSGMFGALAWSPSGTTIATGSDDGTVTIWDASSGKPRTHFRGAPSFVRAIAWAPDGGLLAAGGSQGRVIVWDARTGRQKAALQTAGDILLDLAWSGDSEYLGIADGSAAPLVWDRRKSRASPLPSAPGPMTALAWCLDGRVLATASAAGVSLWSDDPSAGSQRLTTAGVQALERSPDGTQIAIASEPTSGRSLTLWDIRTRRQAVTLLHQSDAIACLKWRPHSASLAAVQEDGTVALWDTRTGMRGLQTHLGVTHLKETGLGVWSLSWSSDGSALGMSSVYRVKAWYPERPVQEVVFPYNRTIRSVAWQPGGAALAVGIWDEFTLLWNADASSVTGVTKGDLPSWSPDGAALATSRHIVPDVRLKTRKEYSPQDYSEVNALAWSPDGQVLATGREDGEVRVWRRADAALAHRLVGLGRAVQSLTWRDDGRVLAVGYAGGVVRLWSVPDYRELVTLYTLDAGTGWLAVTPDGYFTGSSGCGRNLRWRPPNDPEPSRQYQRRFHRPHLLSGLGVFREQSGAPHP